MNAIVMKKTSGKKTTNDLRKEYAFEYSKAKPNRFAAQLDHTTAVVLDPDVAAVFTSSRAVNKLLRSAIDATTTRPTPSKKAPRKGSAPKHRAA